METPLGITLQRRHGPGCVAGKKHLSYTFESEERKRGASSCACRIYGCGTLGGVYKRMPTKQREWALAARVIAPYIAAGSWAIAPPPPPSVRESPANAAESSPDGTKLEDAIDRYRKDLEQAQSARGTIAQYGTIFKELKAMAAILGIRTIEGWKPADIRTLINSWTVSPRTAKKKRGQLHAIFQMFVEDEVIEANPVRQTSRKNRALHLSLDSCPPKNPYTDQELERMLNSCRSVLDHQTRNCRSGNVIQIRKLSLDYGGDDLADFIEISSYTGLRISDVTGFHIDRLTEAGEVKIRCLKNGKWVAVWIPEFLRAVIRRRAAQAGPFIFGAYQDLEFACVKWRRRLNKLWKAAGPWSSKPTHHRFRHTFVRRLLEHGVSVRRISELIGDTEKVIEESYSQWMPERQAALSRDLERAFANAPRFHR
jgi:site-specific recombinase XerD